MWGKSQCWGNANVERKDDVKKMVICQKQKEKKANVGRKLKIYIVAGQFLNNLASLLDNFL